MWIVNDHWASNQEVPANFKSFALKELKKRWEWMTFDVHYISYALAPEYHNENVFNIDKVMKGVREVIRFFAPRPAAGAEAIREFANYKNFNDATLFPLIDGKITIDSSPKEWWQCYGGAWPTLQPIAIRVFSIGTSSSTSERNFSTWSHIWSNRANRLNFERTVKLVYCFTNLRALQKMKAGTGRTDHVSSYWLQEEIEE